MSSASPIVLDSLYFSLTRDMLLDVWDLNCCLFTSRSELVRVETKQVESSEVSSSSEVPSLPIPACRHESVSFVCALIHKLR